MKALEIQIKLPNLSPSPYREIVVKIVFGLIAAAVVINSYPQWLPHAWGDSGPAQAFTNPSLLLHLSLYSWNPLANAGGAFPNNGGPGMPLVPYALFGIFLHSIGATPGLTQAVFVWLVHFASMFFMYKVLRRTLPNESFVAALNGAVAYDLSTFAASTYWRIFNVNVGMLAFIPFTLLVTIRLIKEQRRDFLKFAITTSLAMFFFAPAIANIAYIPTVVISNIIFLVWILKWGGGRIRPLALVGRIAMLLGSVAALNAWYMFPMISASLTAFQSTGTLISNSFMLNVTESTSLHMMLLGLPNGINWVIWGSRFTQALGFILSPEMQLLAVLLVSTMIFGLLTTKVRSVAVLGLGLYATGLFLSQGSSGITGQLFLWCFNHVPFFAVMRIPTQSSVPFLLPGLAFGVAAGSSWIADNSKNLSHRLSQKSGLWRPYYSKCLDLSPFIVLVVVLILGWPLILSGAILTSPIAYQTPPVSTSIQVPSSYSAAAQYLTRHNLGSYRVLVLPLSSNGNRMSKWSPGATVVDQSWLLLQSDAIFGISGAESGSSILFDELLTSSITRGQVSLLRTAEIMGAKYVLVERDSVASVFAGTSGTSVVDHLPSQGPLLSDYFHSLATSLREVHAKRLVSWGQLTLFALPISSVRPLIFGVSASQGSRVPGLSFRVNSPIDLTVISSGGAGTFNLVMNQSWDPGWQLLTTRKASPDYLNFRDCVMSLIYRFSGVDMKFCSQEAGSGGLRAKQALPLGDVWRIKALKSSSEYHLIYEPQLALGLSRLISLGSCGILGTIYGVSRARRSRRVRILSDSTR